jgi:hypothetical protein
MSWFTPYHIIILVLAALGVLLFIIYFLNLARVQASEGWLAVQGTITESWIDESITTDQDGSASSRYAPKVRYRYTVMGTEYQGERIAFGPGRSGSRSSVEKVLAKYPKGSAALVYYNPEKPADAVLDRSIAKSLLVTGAIFIALAIYVYLRWS